jgi:hypothetical protein
MKNSAGKIILVALIGCLIFIEEGVFDKTIATLSTDEEVCVRSVTAECDLAVGEEGIEFSA